LRIQHDQVVRYSIVVVTLVNNRTEALRAAAVHVDVDLTRCSFLEALVGVENKALSGHANCVEEVAIMELVLFEFS
jgi:hypothetical protein